MRRDKKTREGKPRFVLAKGIGEVEFGVEVEESLVKDVLNGLEKKSGSR